MVLLDASPLSPRYDARSVDRSTRTVPAPWLSFRTEVSAVIVLWVTNTSSLLVDSSQTPMLPGERPSGKAIVDSDTVPPAIRTPAAFVATSGPWTVTLLIEELTASAMMPVYC
jgi:hypothetical protein